MSQVVEMAVEQLLEEHAPAAADIVATPGAFRGAFSREETYGGR